MENDVPMEDTFSRLERLGIKLPPASEPAASYANCVLEGGLLFVSGKGPSSGARGKLGIHYTTEEGYKYARETAIEILAVVQSYLGSLDKVARVVKVQGFINASAEFEEHHKVLDGFSDLMAEVFGDRGVHARSVFGAVSLRGGLPVIIDSIFAVREEEH
ncbi:RidA family protein [Paenibacillus sp. 2TAB19]|uniref:RidA family protein n=1 Tax=Paenibacillus sp. 2TAB19 TaxID=3233003 RepID=UPI003F9AF210